MSTPKGLQALGRRDGTRRLGWPLPTGLAGSRRLADTSVRLLALLIATVGAASMVVPFLWMAATSLKTDAQVFVYPPQWVPDPLAWDNYPKAWHAAPFLIYTINTLVIALASIVGTLLSCALAAYGFARVQARGRDLLFALLLSTMMVPGIVTLIPTFILFSRLGWVNTPLPLIVPHFFGSAFFIFMLRQFFLTIPIELEDAAYIDGANALQILVLLFLPLSRPALTAVAVFQFIWSWNDFVGPLIYLTDTPKRTIAIGLQAFLQQYGADWTRLMAASVMATLPILVIFFIAQRYFIQGIVTTGLAGR
jgi:ABC-type glycerol-3-phosphate transport system permease component